MRMKKISLTTFMASAALALSFTLLSQGAMAQNITPEGKPIPENVNKILTYSCTPCHTKDGGLMAKAKLNLSEWEAYSPDKQKAKAAAIFSEVNKGGMPPKMAREKHPETIPTGEQIATIKKWAESFPQDSK